MDLIDLKVNARTAGGNGAARALRREGYIPAVLYGPSTDNISLSVETAEFENVLRTTGSGQALLNLVMQNGETKQAMIRELQRHPVSSQFLHIDFYAFDMNQKIRIKVPVTAIGKSKGVELGGLLQLIRREIEILCLPLEMPENIEVDVSDLNIGDSIHVDEISLPEGAELIADVNYTVVTVSSPKVEEEAVEEDEEEGEDVEGVVKDDEAADDAEEHK